MSLLTKKFTRDSLKRASGGGVGVSNDIEDASRVEIIRKEISRTRSKSLQNRNALNEQQRRHRSLSRGPSSPYRSVGIDNRKFQPDPSGPKLPNTLHPNDVFNQAYNEAELLTQMSSLTEPTWAPSVVGGSDINSVNHRQTHQNQRSRTVNYNNLRHQTRFQQNNPRIRPNRATITISTAKDRKEKKILLLDNSETETGKVDPFKSNSDYRHHETHSVRTEGIEVYGIERDEVRDEVDDGETLVKNTPSIPQNASKIDKRDDVPIDGKYLQGSNEKKVSSKRRSKARRADDDSNVLRTRGRSGRPKTKGKRMKRSSSVSSQRSSQTTKTASAAPVVSKSISTSSSFSASISSRKRSTKNSSIPRGRRISNEKQKSSTNTRSSSVPPSIKNSKHYQRTSSMPPSSSEIKEMHRRSDDSTNESSGDENVVLNRINHYGGVNGHEQKMKTTSDLNSNATMSTMVNTASTVADTSMCSSQSKSQSMVSFSLRSPISGMSSVEHSLTPSSAVEAARISLRSRLHRSNSNRSTSSVQSESIISSAGNQRVPLSVNTDRKTQAPSAVVQTKTTYPSRTHKLQDAHVKKIHEQRLQRRLELEMERRQKEEEKERRKSATLSHSTIEADGEPHHTTITTLVFDFLLFNSLLLLALPKRIILYLWSRAFSKKWTAHRKNVLLTGANFAMGSEIAKQFAMEGANLILMLHSTSSSKNNLNWLVEECHALGSGKILCYSADLSNTTSTRLALQQAAKDFNDRFDVVILNGEYKSHGCLFEEILDVHEIEKMVKENIFGCIMTLHHLLKLIPKTSDSRIVILSSTSGMVASPYRSVCGATQHALKGFCDSIRMELNSTYTERRAPKVCFASFPELVGQNILNRDNIDSPVSRMGAERAPMKTRSWARVPLQQAVHDLLHTIKIGERDFGAPQHVVIWRLIQVLAPGLVDFSVFRHFRKTQYRAVEDVRSAPQKKH